MPIEVELPDGSVVEFPDGTDNATMERALASYHAQPDFSEVRGSMRGSAPKGLTRRAAENLVGETGANALDAFQHHAMNALHGGAQLVEHGLSGLADRYLDAGNPIRRSLTDAVTQDDAATIAREREYQARVPDGAAAYGGAAVGELLPWMTGAGAIKATGLVPKLAAVRDVPTVAGKIGNVAAKTGLLAGQGALMGALSPVTEEGDYAGQKLGQIGVGAVTAPVLAGVLGGVGASARVAKGLARYLTPSGRDLIANQRLATLYGADAGTLAQLQQASRIPGFQPTPAQALGTPEAVQAERVLRNNGLTAPAFAARESANNAALRESVAGVAGTDAALDAAYAARSQGPGAFWRDNLTLGAEDGRYGRAQQHLATFLGSRNLAMPEFHILDSARKIAGQIQRGTVTQTEGDAAIRALQPKTKAGQKALDQALGVIDGGMVNPGRIVSQLELLTRSGNKAVSGAAADHLATIAKNQDGQGWVHARVLDDIRQNIGSMLGAHSPHGKSSGAEKAIYGPLSAKIVNTIDRAVPGYRDSLAAYARSSRPINDMEAGRAALAAIDSGARDAGGNQNVSLAQIKALLAKDAKERYGMSPQARAQLEAVLEALQQRSITNNTIAATGPGTAADTLRGAANSPVAQRLVGHAASAIGGAFGGFPGYAAGAMLTEGMVGANNAVVRRMGAKAASAEETAKAIEQVLNSRRPRGLLSGMPQYLLPYSTK